jgi:hypothetical protein
MNRKRLATLAVIALAWAGSAQGALERIEEAYELTLQQVRLPAHAAGQVVVSKCATCEVIVLRVDGATSYHVGNAASAVSLSDLLAAVDLLEHTQVEPILVFYQPENKVVTRIVLGGGN